MEQKGHLSPEQDALEHITTCTDKPFLEGRFINPIKERGVITRENIEPSSFVVEYRGKIISQGTPQRDCGDSLNNYLYEFSWSGENWCIDASTDDGTLGRLVNDDHLRPNCEMRKIVCEGKPHLCLFAVKTISAGEEITYDYGALSYPWRSKESNYSICPPKTDPFPTSTSSDDGLQSQPSFSSAESSFDDDDLLVSGPDDSCSSTNMASEMKMRDGTKSIVPRSLQARSKTCTAPFDASCSRQEARADSSSEADSDEDRRHKEAKQKHDVSPRKSKNYCYVCGKGLTKLARHLFNHANEEPEIAEAFSLPVKSRERKKLLDNLRNRGNAKHNQEVLKSNCGVGAQTCVHCLYCKGMFKQKEMWRHVARCPSKMAVSSTAEKTSVSREFSLAGSSVTERVATGVWEMLRSMKQDDVAIAIEKDPLLMQLANHLTMKYGNTPSKYNIIRQKLRQMARLLLVLKERSVFTFEDAIKPQNFYTVAEAVKHMSGFDAVAQCYKTPGLALKLGHSLQRLGAILLRAAAGNEQILKDTKTFMKLCSEEWTHHRTAFSQLKDGQIKNPSTVPFTLDVQLFYKYLEKTSTSALENLQTHENPEAYSALCRVTLVQLSILNRCAPEVSRMTLKTFQGMDDMTQVLSKHFIRLNILNKRGQTVAVLFTSELINAIKRLVNKRDACGVHEDNPFLFAQPDSSVVSLYRVRDCILGFSCLCNVRHSQQFQAMTFHKHIARIFQILHLKNDELDHLAKLLGQDIKAVWEYYRTPESAVELAKIARLILEMEKGSLERFKGNSLEDIEIEDELQPDEEQGSSDNSDTEENNESDCIPQQSGTSYTMEQHGSQMSPEEDALEHIKSQRDKAFLEERFINHSKGKGVFTRESIEPSSFVIEYRGKVFPQKETRNKKRGDFLNNYLFDFSYNGGKWRIDASKEDGTLGRLVNDDHTSPNCEIKKIVFEEVPHICLFAVRNISPDEEITYNYGDCFYPWRFKVEESATSVSAQPVDDYPMCPNLKTSPDVTQCGTSEGQENKIDGELNPPEESNHCDVPPENPTPRRKHYCYVCGIASTKLYRHLFIHRKEVPEIAEVYALPDNSLERIRRLNVLRERGNRKYNEGASNSQGGPLQKTEGLSNPTKEYAVCPYCKGTYVRKTIWRHYQKCVLNCTRASTGRSKVSSFAESPMSKEDVIAMMKRLKKDDITLIIRKDPHILQLAQFFYHNHDDKPRAPSYIKQKLREMARLLLVLRKRSIFCFEEALKPKNFSKLIQAVREMTGFNEKKNSYDRPGFNLKLGNSIKVLADLNFANALKQNADEQTQRDAELFMKLCAKQWSSASQAYPEVRRPLTVVFTRDAQLLYQYIEKIAMSALESLNARPRPHLYLALLRVTITQVSLLNHCSEICRLSLKSFNERNQACINNGLMSMHRVKIVVQGEGGKNIILTMTPELLSTIALLISKREECGVKPDNPFLFAKPSMYSTSLLKAHEYIRVFSKQCGAKDPNMLRSEYFRKYMRRTFQILSLTDNELGQLAKLLGCDIPMDSDYYQSPKAVTDIAKISELISAKEFGHFEKFQGKSLNEIKIADELEPDLALTVLEKSSAAKNKERAERARQRRGQKKKLLAALARMKELKILLPRLDVEKFQALNSIPQLPSLCNPVDSEPEEDATQEMNEPEDPEEKFQTTASISELPSLCNPVDSEPEDDSIHEINKPDDAEEELQAPVSISELPSLCSPIDSEPEDDSIQETNEPDDAEEKLQAPSSTSQLPSPCSPVDFEPDDDSIQEMNEPEDSKEELQTPGSIPQLPSLCNPVDSKMKPLSIQETNNPDEAETPPMTCSHCKMSMLKGQTAFQKKGFSEVFCSKSCLFEMFPVIKPVSKTCHYCLNTISQCVDLIMAAVDRKGTMKDFCSVACLCSFKSNSMTGRAHESVCSMCNKSSDTLYELTLNEAVHKFCSSNCLEGFRRENNQVVTCENCHSGCPNEPFILSLETGRKCFCSAQCLDEMKKKHKKSYRCTMCSVLCPMSDMAHHKSVDNMVELFCTQSCLMSYTAQHKEKTERSEELEHIRESKENMNIDDGTAHSMESPAMESEVTPKFIYTKSPVCCCHCGKKLLTGETVCQEKRELFCSTVCLSLKYPCIKIATRNCCSCSKVITQPGSVLLLPVDESGSVKELCSKACLTSFTSKQNSTAPKQSRPQEHQSECLICAKLCSKKYKLAFHDMAHNVCSECCVITYHRINNLPLFACEICDSICHGKRLMLEMEQSVKVVCSEECLIRFKEKIKKPQSCVMCQTYHQMSDMVENTNNRKVDFFCSHRCMMVYKAQTLSGRTSPSGQDKDMREMKPSQLHEEVKPSVLQHKVRKPSLTAHEEVKPTLPSQSSIKEEPLDEAYSQDLPSPMSVKNIKDEPAGSKVGLIPHLFRGRRNQHMDLKIDSVFSLKGSSTTTRPSTAPATPSSASAGTNLTSKDTLASCSNCSQVLPDGKTVYQRKAHSEIFCSTSCLLKFYQIKQVKRTCSFCLQTITQPKGSIKALVDKEGTKKDFCSQTCLSCYTYKTIIAAKTQMKTATPQSQCSMCSRYCISKREIIHQGLVHKICSNPCFLRFCKLNNMVICDNCNSCCNAPLMLRTEEGNKALCGAECLAQFKQKTKAKQPCSMCRTPHLMSAMVESKNSKDMLELYCTSSCIMASKIQAVNAAGVPLNCDNCGTMAVPAGHIAMSDTSIRNFCSLNCAIIFKEAQKDAARPLSSAASFQKMDDSDKRVKLWCSQCERIIKSIPKVTEEKGKAYFFCCLICFQKFNRANNVMRMCEYCKNERIVNDSKRVEDEDYYFCSDDCRMLLMSELEKRGKYCRSCTYCLSISKLIFTVKDKKKTIEFCSEACITKYNKLQSSFAHCENCKCKGKLKQTFPLLGQVRQFCDRKCLLLFCNKMAQKDDTGSSQVPEASAVITNVISLASILNKQRVFSTCASQNDSNPGSERSLLAHVSAQTVTMEQKNKSMLCSPLLHNKGVSCATNVKTTGAQTDDLAPNQNVIQVPMPVAVPVPVYVPVPVNMYSPIPFGVPLPLPVPMIIPGRSDHDTSRVEPAKERLSPEPLKNDVSSKAEVPEKPSEREDGEKNPARTKGELPSRGGDLETKHHGSLTDQDLSFAYRSIISPCEIRIFKDPSLNLLLTRQLQLERRASAASSGRKDSHRRRAPPPPASRQPVGKVFNKNKGRKLKPLGKADTVEASQRKRARVSSKSHRKLKRQYGIDAWKRWIRWRETQTNLDLVSSHYAAFKEDFLCCSAAELNNGLCSFIAEVRQPNGERYNPSSLFYLCLGIQQHLFENGRMENIFSDLIYSKFSTEFTKILRGSKPTVRASGHVNFSVEEEFLWDCKQLGAFSPMVLLNTLLFFCCKHFGFTTVEQHRRLSFSHIRLCTKTTQNHTKSTFLRFYPPLSTSESETDAVVAKKRRKTESSPEVLEMMENIKNPLRCPVRLYEFYYSKCLGSVRQSGSVFYLLPDRCCVPQSPLWFSSTPLDDATLEAMLLRILTIRGMRSKSRKGQHQRTPGASPAVSDGDDSE